MRDLSVEPVAAPGLVIRAAGNESLVHDPATGQVHVLNGTAVRILQRCTGAVSLAQIVDELVTAGGADRARVAQDVVSICGAFKARGLLS
jgi:coenzyme PQQ synthesis protein D (PqqD)